MHMDPFLPNLGDPGQGPRLVPGMALAIEPMLTAGDPATRELDDGWTVVTADGGRAVHWEHSVAITEDGPRVLTLPADGSPPADRVSPTEVRTADGRCDPGLAGGALAAGAELGSCP